MKQQKSIMQNADPLAVGLTRPSMLMGISLKLFFANILFSTLVCIDAQIWLGIPLFIVLHLIFAKLSIKEPTFYRLWYTAFTKTPPVLNHAFWGKTNSYDVW